MHCRYAYLLLIVALLLTAAPILAQHAAEDVDRVAEHYPEAFEALRAAEPTLDVFAKPEYDGTAFGHWALPKSQAAWLLSQQLSQMWDAAANAGQGDWMDLDRTTLNRNDAGFTTELLIESVNPISGEWEPSGRQVTTRDDQNRATENRFENWDPDANGGAGDWMPAQRSVNTYNDQGRLLTNTTEIFNEDTGEFEIFFRTTRTYDGSGELVLERIFESALFGPLALSIRRAFEYNQNQDVTRELIQSYDDVSASWVNSGLELNTYDENGEEVENLEQDWDETANAGSGDWVNDERTVTAFTPNSSDPTLTVETEQVWDSGDWLNVEREVVEVSASAPHLTETEQFWDPNAPGKSGSQGAWINDKRTQATIEGSFPTVSVDQVWDPAAGGGAGDWVNEERDSITLDPDRGVITESLTELWDGAAFVNDSRLLMTYVEVGGGNPTSVAGERVVAGFELRGNYPNPFTSTTRIQFQLATTEHVTVEVFDMLGRQVVSLLDEQLTPGSHEVSFDARSLPAGLYVYRLAAGEQSVTANMVLAAR